MASASDYASEVLNDPWDMDSREDLAEYIPSADYGSGLGAFSVSGGIFSSTINDSGPAYFHLLSPGQPSTNALGKNGQRYPIDSTKYRYLHIRMKGSVASNIIVHWNTDTTYATSYVRTVSIPTVAEWRVYEIDLETIGIGQRVNETRSWSEAAEITGLRIDLGLTGQIEIDWITLTGAAPATFAVAHSFTRTALDTSYNLFIDDDSDPFNGYQQALVENGTTSTPVNIDPRNFYPGTYKICGYTSAPDSTPSSVVCSPGDLVVNQPPLLRILQPDARGGEDFATAVLGNPWNMNSLDDFNSFENLKGRKIHANALINGRQGDFFCASNVAGNSDPIQTSLLVAANAANRIDASRYKNLTIEAYVEGDQDIVNGSVLRIIGWNQERDEFAFNGDDTIIQRQNSAWFSLTQDLTDFALEPVIHPAGSFPVPFWAGFFNMLRVDIHEFTPAREYCIDTIELRADDEANSRFAIAFEAPDSDSLPASVSVSFFYSTTKGTTGGEAIVTDLKMDRDSRAYLWDTSSVPNGTYYVYGVASDGFNTYAAQGHRIVIDHGRAQDTTPPVLKASASSTPGSQSVLVSGYAIDNHQIALVEVLLANKLVGVIEPALFNSEARSAYASFADASRAGFSSSFSIAGLSEVPTEAELRAYDTAGNRVTVRVSIGAGSDSGLKFKARLSKRKKSLKITITNADQCSEIKLVGYNNRSTIESTPGEATLLKTFSNITGAINIKIGKLRGLKKNKKKGNGPLFLGVLCDGSLSSIKKIPVTKLRSSKKIKTWQKYLKFLSKRLK